MKKNQLLTLCLTILLAHMGVAQEFSETIQKSESFASKSKDNLLVVYNVEGSIHVEGYHGDTVQISAKKKVKGNNQRQLEHGKTEIGVKTATKGNIIYVYLDSPYTEFNVDTGRFSHEGSWTGNHYHYTLDYTIKIPKQTSVELSTINRGDIFVKNVDAKDLTVKNINGGITMEHVAGKTYVNALNRDIAISYSKNPPEDSVFKSLNGDITLQVQKGLNADVSFKTLNGDIYTNFETKSINNGANLNKKGGKRGTKYKIDKNTEFQIGNGGIRMDFDLLNGDVTIKG